MRTSILYSTCLLLFLITFGCSSDIEPDPITRWSEYMPLAIGNTWHYEVESITYLADETENDEFYFRKDSIVSEEIVDQGKIFTIQSYKRYSNSSNWQPYVVYLIKILGDHLIIQTDGIDYLKIVNPINLGVEWNGHLYNTLDDNNYILSRIEKGSGDFTYSTPEGYIQVIENDNQDYVVNLKNTYSVYGRGIGLVEYFSEDLVYCQDVSCLRLEEIVDGIKIKMVLTNFREQ